MKYIHTCINLLIIKTTQRSKATSNSYSFIYFFNSILCILCLIITINFTDLSVIPMNFSVGSCQKRRQRKRYTSKRDKVVRRTKIVVTSIRLMYELSPKSTEIQKYFLTTVFLTFQRFH